jgi:hypothetical protein
MKGVMKKLHLMQNCQILHLQILSSNFINFGSKLSLKPKQKSII